MDERNAATVREMASLGLVVATVLTLVVIPTFYSLIERDSWEPSLVGRWRREIRLLLHKRNLRRLLSRLQKEGDESERRRLSALLSFQAAVDEVNKLQGNVAGIPAGKVEIPDLQIPDEPAAGRQPLSKEAVTITARTIQQGVATEDLAEALEVGYRGFGEIACTEAAKEGISAFLERRKPAFKK